jgi:hypothetical protein
MPANKLYFTAVHIFLLCRYVDTTTTTTKPRKIMICEMMEMYALDNAI